MTNPLLGDDVGRDVTTRCNPGQISGRIQVREQLGGYARRQLAAEDRQRALVDKATSGSAAGLAPVAGCGRLATVHSSGSAMSRTRSRRSSSRGRRYMIAPEG